MMLYLLNTCYGQVILSEIDPRISWQGKPCKPLL